MKRLPVVALIVLALAAALILISRNFGRRLDRSAVGAQPGLQQIPPPAAGTGRPGSTGSAPRSAPRPAAPPSAAPTRRRARSPQPPGPPPRAPPKPPPEPHVPP